MTLLRSFKQRSFTFLWIGQTISALGDSLYKLALSWWVLEATGSATIMSTVLILSFIPSMLFVLMGGIVVDRFPRLHVMLTSDVLRGVVVTIVSLLAFSGQLEVWHIFVATVIFSLVDAFFQPAYAATIPEIIPESVLPSANSLTAMSRQLSNIVGPAIGALILSFGGVSLAFMINALSFFASAAFLVLIPMIPASSTTTSRDATIWSDLREGIQVVRQTQWLWITIAITALINIAQTGPFSVALPFLVKEHFSASVDTLGLLYSAASLGAVVGAVLLGRSSTLRRRGVLAYGFLIASGLMTLAIGLPLPVAAVLLVVFLRGLSITGFDLIWTSTLQALVPRQVLGRVLSIDYFGSFVLLPIGFAVAGWGTEQFGSALVFLVGGGLTAGLAILALTQARVRELN